HSPHHLDLAANLIRFMYTQGYGETLHYDRVQLEALAALGQRHPLVFLPTHKSMLDSLVLKYALYENGLPPNHTAGGINMNFFPMGGLMRRTGIFFIRRSFKDNEVYKFVLHHYLDYLVEKRFPLEWYIEGTRSRSGCSVCRAARSAWRRRSPRCATSSTTSAAAISRPRARSTWTPPTACGARSTRSSRTAWSPASPRGPRRCTPSAPTST